MAKTKEMAKRPQEETFKPKWFNKVPVVVKKVVLETTQDKLYVTRVRLETNIGNITHKPYVREKLSEELVHFGLEFSNKKSCEITSFIAENPMLSLLAKNTKKDGQEVVLSYAEIETFNEKEDVLETYRYMLDSQFKLIYYKDYDKTDTYKLDKMQEIADKNRKQEVEM